MGAISQEKRALKAEVERAVIKAVEKLGPSGLNRAGIIRQFSGRGASQATMFRWIASILAAGVPGHHLARQVRKAAAARAKRQPDPAAAAAEVAAEVREAVPVPLPKVEELVAGAHSAADVLDRLDQCIQIAKQVIEQATTADGAIRNPKLALNASEHMRRTLETVMRLHAAIRNVAQLDQFIAELIGVIEQVALERPEAAHLILSRTRMLAARWTGQAAA